MNKFGRIKTDLAPVPSGVYVYVDPIPRGTYMCIAFKWSAADYYDHFGKLKKAYDSSGFSKENIANEVSLILKRWTL
ncbi:hypothetical protein [Bacillus sonorensis]|uniref:hypothetical protein n=1 Tax=Bacillus sonorensis TaxID=119858 RepID=UPI001ABF29C2|nr:hypothetical protein [Bacillus sonorensis]